jgi:hypothetical protein
MDRRFCENGVLREVRRVGRDIVATIGARQGCGGGCTILAIWEHGEGKV